MSRIFDFGQDYFTATIGYVIEGKHFKKREAAFNYLRRDDIGMDVDEANNYLNRMVRVFTDKTKALTLEG